MSNLQKQLFGLFGPGHDLLQRKKDEGMPGRASGYVEYIHKTVIIGKTTNRFVQQRSISNARRPRLDARKSSVLLLLFVAISTKNCFAQTPPPLDQRAIESIPATVAQRLATRFSLGAFAGRFEKTTLGAVRDAVGAGTVHHKGDAGESIYWLCYKRAQHRVWIMSSGGLGGPDHLVTEVVEERSENDTEISTDCAIVPKKFEAFAFDGKLTPGMSRSGVLKALGPPSKSGPNQMVYSHYGKLANGFDETAWLILQFRKEKLVFMRGGKTTTN